MGKNISKINLQIPFDDISQRIRDEIFPVLEKAITDDGVYFQNPNIGQCWEKKNCTKKDCPVMGKLYTRCWQVVGTFCGGEVQGKFAQKYDSCTKCIVYKEASPTLVEEFGEKLNNMLFLMWHEKKNTEKHLKKIEYLNKELLSSLENLDSRNREIQEMVITDKLTGLYNRHNMMTMLDDEITRCQRKGYTFCLLMIDVDNFKSLNDTYGHINGDNILSFLGTMIKNTIRQYDRAYRYGGEEFAVILPETDPTLAWVVAERIRKKFEEKVFHVGRTGKKTEKITRTLSIGLVSYDEEADAKQILALADEAMYSAKSHGKNMVFRHGID